MVSKHMNAIAFECFDTVIKHAEQVVETVHNIGTLVYIQYENESNK